MSSSSRQLLLEIARIKDNIRKKYSALRNNDLETQRQLAIQYKPLIKPLRQLTKKRSKTPKIKQEIKEEPVDEPPEEEYNLDEGPREASEPLEVDEILDVDEHLVDDESLHEVDVEEEEEPESPVPPLPSSDDEEAWDAPNTVDELLAKYLSFIVRDGQSKADFTYGIVYSGDGWKMGRYPVHFINNDIIIKDRRYRGTPGLFELIFKKHPTNTFTKDDLKTYRSMLVQTRAHVGKDGKVISSRGYKYTNIISNMFPPRRKITDDVAKVLTPIMTRAKRTLSKDHLANEEKRKKVGDGIMMRVTRNQVDYRHWDDPNELCERLFLLIASKEAGNTSHDGEIISILEELKEAGVIKDFDHVRM